MKVKDLIKKLERYDGDTEVWVIDTQWLHQVQEAKVRTARVDTIGGTLATGSSERYGVERVALITFEGE